MSNGVVDVLKNGVFAVVDGREVTNLGKVGEWMPWGSGFKAENVSVVYEMIGIDEEVPVPDDRRGTRQIVQFKGRTSIAEAEIAEATAQGFKYVNPEVMKGSVEILWGVEWDEATTEYPNAIAHVYAYPGDYLEIGRYENEVWTSMGGMCDMEDLLLSQWDRDYLTVYWYDGYKHLPALRVLYPSGTETPGGKGEEIRWFLAEQARSLAVDKACTTSWSLPKEGTSLFNSVRLKDITIQSPEFPTHSDASKRSLTYSYVFEDENGEDGRHIDVRVQVLATDVFVRPDKDTLPKWIAKPVDYAISQLRRTDLGNRIPYDPGQDGPTRGDLVQSCILNECSVEWLAEQLKMPLTEVKEKILIPIWDQIQGDNEVSSPSSDTMRE